MHIIVLCSMVSAIKQAPQTSYFTASILSFLTKSARMRDKSHLRLPNFPGGLESNISLDQGTSIYFTITTGPPERAMVSKGEKNLRKTRGIYFHCTTSRKIPSLREESLCLFTHPGFVLRKRMGNQAKSH